MTHQWKLSCWALQFVTLFSYACITTRKQTSKQNGRHGASRLAPVATNKPLQFTQHKACGSCGSTGKLCDYPQHIWCSWMSSSVQHDECGTIYICSTFHVLKDPHNQTKDIKFIAQLLQGRIVPISRWVETHNRKQYYILSCLLKNKHT